MIERCIYQQVAEKLFKGKVIIVSGARQTGKSTLLKRLLTNNPEKSIYLDCDDPNTRNLLQNQSTPNLVRLLGNQKLVFIDEAQRVEDIGLSLKQMYDNVPGCQIIVSGSSAFELSNKINEPLTGRKFEYTLFPLSFNELANHSSLFDETRLLETRMIYGYYPDIVNVIL